MQQMCCEQYVTRDCTGISLRVVAIDKHFGFLYVEYTADCLIFQMNMNFDIFQFVKTVDVVLE